MASFKLAFSGILYRPEFSKFLLFFRNFCLFIPVIVAYFTQVSCFLHEPIPQYQERLYSSLIELGFSIYNPYGILQTKIQDNSSNGCRNVYLLIYRPVSKFQAGFKVISQSGNESLIMVQQFNGKTFKSAYSGIFCRPDFSTVFGKCCIFLAVIVAQLTQISRLFDMRNT